MTDAARILPESRLSSVGHKEPEQVGALPADHVGAETAESFGPNETENFHAPILDMDQAALERSFHQSVVVDFASRRKPARDLADSAGGNVRAAKNWLDGNNAPDLLHGLKLAVTCPAWRAELRRILAMDAALEPDVEQALAEIVRRYPQLARGAK